MPKSILDIRPSARERAHAAARAAEYAQPKLAKGTCKPCQRFFARFSCGQSRYLECDCPKCQGYCRCK